MFKCVSRLVTQFQRYYYWQKCHLMDLARLFISGYIFLIWKLAPHQLELLCPAVFNRAAGKARQCFQLQLALHAAEEKLKVKSKLAPKMICALKEGNVTQCYCVNIFFWLKNEIFLDSTILLQRAIGVETVPCLKI